jgi:hypothetical protein
MSRYLCPDCGTDTRVLETRPSYNRLRRRRTCLSSDHKFSTVEVPLTAPEEILDLVTFALTNAEGMAEDMIEYVRHTTQHILLGLDLPD